MSETLANEQKPQTAATLTVRIIKSFKFRTEKSLVLHDVNLLTTTVADLKERAKNGGYHYSYEAKSPFSHSPVVADTVELSYPNAARMEALQKRTSRSVYSLNQINRIHSSQNSQEDDFNCSHSQTL